MSGTLFAVVGPSGAGKDSLIGYARRTLYADVRFVFPPRYITRPREAGGEAHVQVSPETFAEMRGAGEFALDWDAHGLSYGVAARVAGVVTAGRHAIVNVSRGIIGRARETFEHVHVVHVMAPPDVIKARLEGRGREQSEDIRARLDRMETGTPSGSDVSTICNDGDLADAGQALLNVLRREL